MIVPAIVIAVLPDDRLVIEYKVDNLARRCLAPHPLDMHPDAGVGTCVKIDYSDGHGAERLIYPSPLVPAPTTEWRSIVLPSETRGPSEPVDDELGDPVKLAEDRAVFRMTEAEVDECLRARGLDPEEVGREGSRLLRRLLAEHRHTSETRRKGST